MGLHVMRNIYFIILIFLISSCERRNSKDLITDSNETQQTMDSIILKADQDISDDRMDGFFDNLNTFEILDIKKNSNYPSSDNDTTQCLSWTLSISDIKIIIKDSRQINGPEWHHLFGHFPCDIKGHLKQNNEDFEFHINAGSWLTVNSKDTSIYYGSFDPKYKHLFLGQPWDEKDDE
jgi:hypothetical protein